MEKLLLNVCDLYFEVVGCRYDTVKKGYYIKYKCLTCGCVKNALLIKDRVCTFRCNNCYRLLYISPICNDKLDRNIVGYNILKDNQYRKIRKRYKEVERVENLSVYINESLKIGSK